ncbi:MAG: T9SS type A sorting domain-containing protein, partial [Chitinophagaceae bacterium]
VNHYFAYNTLVVPSAGVYRISLRILSNAVSQVRIGHSTFTYKILTLPSTNGEWRTITDTLTLPALSFTGIHVVSGTFKFNWFMIDNCSVSDLPVFVGGPFTGIGKGATASNAGDTTLTETLNAARIIYPNPGSGMISIVPGNEAYRKIVVTNATGQVVQNWTVNPGQKLVTKSVGTWKSGTYIFVFEAPDGQRRTIKFVKP